MRPVSSEGVGVLRPLLAALLAASLVWSCAEKGAVGPAAAAGPGPEAKPSPTERYLRALDRRSDGDAKGYYDELIALAHEEPDSRAGRKARAIVQGNDPLMLAAYVGVLAAIAVPNFMKFQERAKQSSVKSNLKMIHIAQSAFHAERGRYCRTFEECGVLLQDGEGYVYFLAPKEVMGTGAADAALSPAKALAALKKAGVTPKVTKKGFVAAAVANLDADDELDIWTIDESGELLNLASDL